MQKHLRGHLPHLLPAELGIPHQPWPSAEVKAHLAQAVVHGQAVAIALYATLVAQCLCQALAQCQCSVLYGMMLVHVQVATAGDVKINVAMARYLLEHMVEETKSGRNVTSAVTVQCNAYLDIRFVRLSGNRCTAVARKQYLHYASPPHILAYYQAFASEILRQKGIRVPVAYDIGVGHIHLGILHITGEHGGARLASGKVIVRKRAVDMLRLELHSFSTEDVEHKVVRRPEVGLGIRVGTKSVLVAYHHKPVVRVLCKERQGANGTWHKLKLAEGVNLLVLGFLQDGAVAIYEEYSLFHVGISV